MSAGRLFFSDRYGYRFCVTPQRNKKHDNQLNHTSHLLSENVLTADCPWYYTCEYYNAYVAFCREPSQSLDSYFSFNRLKGMGQARISCDHRGSSGAGDAPELTACGRPPFPLSVSTDWGDFSYNIDKFLPKHYNIYKYNT